MYDPVVGRWLEQDPEGFQAGDVNLYRYARNELTAATDPSGYAFNASAAVLWTEASTGGVDAAGVLGGWERGTMGAEGGETARSLGGNPNGLLATSISIVDTTSGSQPGMLSFEPIRDAFVASISNIPDRRVPPPSPPLSQAEIQAIERRIAFVEREIALNLRQLRINNQTIQLAAAFIVTSPAVFGCGHGALVYDGASAIRNLELANEGLLLTIESYEQELNALYRQLFSNQFRFPFGP